MRKRTTTHEKVVIERSYRAKPERVFAAWGSVEACKRWSVPSDTAQVEFDEFDFRIGGRQISRCGERGDLRYLAEAVYHDILDGERIIYSERVSELGALHMVSLTTVELKPEAGGARLRLTCQVVSVDGADGAAGIRAGYGAALENLAREVEPASA